MGAGAYVFGGNSGKFRYALKMESRVLLMKGSATDILYTCLTINLGSFLGLFYTVDVVQVETNQNTTSPRPAHTNAYLFKHVLTN